MLNDNSLILIDFQVNYLFKDPGEPDLAVSSWLPDDECIPPPIDSWAPGAMPTITPQQLDRHERNNRAELLASRRGSLASKATSPTLTTPASVGSLPTDLKPFEQASTKPNTPEPRPPRTAKSAGKIAASRRAQSAGDGTGHSKSSSAPRSVSAQEARKPRPLPPAESKCMPRTDSQGGVLIQPITEPSSRSRRRPASKPEFKGNANPKVPAIRA